MAEKTHEAGNDTGNGTEHRRRRPDWFTLLMGLATLVAASYVLTDGNIWLPQVDPRWLITGAALFVGVLLLASSLRGGRRKR